MKMSIENGLIIDEHLYKVIRFMQRNVPTSKLVYIADTISKLAPIMWEKYEKEYNYIPIGLNITVPDDDYR